MRAVAIDRFGGVEVLRTRDVPAPRIDRQEVLVRVEAAGVGEWDPFEREGGYARMIGTQPDFPYVLGSEGAGVVEAVGGDVARFRPGDRVYAVGFLNPKGGFYAELAAVRADLVAPLPRGLSIEQAAVMGGVGITALRGLEDTLHLRAGESLLVFGASGGIGHLAVQLAKRMGARVLAVASGADGVALAKELGADLVVDGRNSDVVAAARDLAPGGLDAALLTAGGDTAQRALSALRAGGRVAWPTGVEPEPQGRPELQLTGFNGEPDGDILARFHRAVTAGPFTVHVARSFPLEQAAQAHRALEAHYLGKLALRL